ncbi:MAG: ATP-binding protein [Thiohalomonadaceae bacterium]
MNSLRLRLHLLLLGGLALLLVVQMLGLRLIPQALVEDYVLTRLQHDADTLYARLLLQSTLPEQITPTLGTIYDTPLSGHYFRIDAGSQIIRSRSLWDVDLPLAALSEAKSSVSRIAGPAGQQLLNYSRRYEVQGQMLTISVAEDVAAMERTVSSLEQQLLSLSLFALLLVLVMQVWILRRALRPLDDAVAACGLLESGQAHEMDEQGPRELRPLLQAINRLSRHHGLRLARSRRALGNVSHALKTPLAVLQQQADEMERRGEKTQAEAMRQQLGAMAQTIGRELHRARMAGSGTPGARFDGREELVALSETLMQLHQGRVQIALSISGEACALDADDMLELFGNLLDNACKWARERVQVTVQQGADGLHAQIEDDGPGVAAEAWDTLTRPGQRLDESRPGHGLGLSIVQDIIEQYHGTLAFSRSAELGGLKVTLRIPLG